MIRQQIFWLTIYDSYKQNMKHSGIDIAFESDFLLTIHVVIFTMKWEEINFFFVCTLQVVQTSTIIDNY